MVTLHSHRYHYGSADEPVDENRCVVFQSICFVVAMCYIFQEIPILGISTNDLVGMALLGQAQACGTAILCGIKDKAGISIRDIYRSSASSSYTLSLLVRIFIS